MLGVVVSSVPVVSISEVVELFVLVVIELVVVKISVVGDEDVVVLSIGSKISSG